MRLVSLVADGACLFVLSVVLPFYDSTNTAFITSKLLRVAVDSILAQKFWVATICGSYALLRTFIPRWALLGAERRRVRARILKQISVELLGDDLHAHRVTLFREINYTHALLLTFRARIQKMLSSDVPKEDISLPLPFKSKAKWRLFSDFPQEGRYLIAEERLGAYKKSYVMFRVEEDEPERCNSIITYVRYTKKTFVIQNLPDLSHVPLKKLKSIDDVPKNYRDDVRKYLELGRTKDFAVLREFTRLARHFFGAIVLQPDGNEPWGVLLIDSVGDKAPFPESVRERLESFARTLGSVGG